MKLGISSYSLYSAEVLKVVKTSGYDGYLSIEFEGMEDCKTGTKIGFDNVKKMWNNI